MSDQTTMAGLFGRIGNFFRRGSRDAQATLALPDPASPQAVDALENMESSEASGEPRTTFLRPWAKREQAIDQLQNGISTLSDLMGTIRQTLEKNSSRQDELLNYLSHLPEALQGLPESNRVGGETLKAIQISIERQNAQQGKVADVLERMDRDGNEGLRVQGEALKAIRIGIEQQNNQQNKLANVLERMDRDSNESLHMQGEALKAIQAGIEQQNNQQNKLANVLDRMDRDSNEGLRTLDVVRERIDAITIHEEAISRSLQSVGEALESVSMSSESSARVLESLQSNISSRDNQIERVIRKQNTRFTTMLTVAIVMSMAALTAVVVFGYLGYEALSRMAK